MTYRFRFAAYNDVGLGGWDSPQTHTMSRRSAPNEPRILSSPEEGVVSSPYADHFDLRWKIPADNGEPIDNYQIKFCAVSFLLIIGYVLIIEGTTIVDNMYAC